MNTNLGSRLAFSSAIALSTMYSTPYVRLGGSYEDVEGWRERDARRQPPSRDDERLSVAEAKRARKRAARLVQSAKAMGA